MAPSCTDANGNPLTYAIVAQPAHGTASVVSGQLHYVPTAGYTGPDSFTYKANDGTVDSNTATVTVTVTAPGSGVVMVGAGDIADCGVGAGQTAALINALPTATVFTLGDNAYAEGTATDFTNCYQPSWGAFKARTYPAVGNHDWTNRTTGYFPYFSGTPGGVGSPNGYYSYNQGSYWHVVVLNTEVDYSAGSAQELWLRADLAANSTKNVVAYWHRPRFSSDANARDRGRRRGDLGCPVRVRRGPRRQRPRALVRALRPADAGRRRRPDLRHPPDHRRDRRRPRATRSGRSMPTAWSVTARPGACSS